MNSGKRPQTPGPSRWFTLEFYLYYAFTIFAFYVVVPLALRMGSDLNPEYYKFAGRLSKGWLFGRLVDNSDGQYAGFRNHIPTLILVSIVFLLISWSIRIRNGSSEKLIPAWKFFSLFASLVFIGVLHGVGLLKILIILTINFVLARIFGPSPLLPFLVWGFGISVLFMNDYFRGYAFWPSTAIYEGLMPRWYINFNITLLRMLSFSMDYHWSFSADRQKIDSKYGDDSDKSKHRIEYPRKSEEYSYINYLIYCLYIPLYLAGPVITFNDFIHQIHQRSFKNINWRSTIIYGVRMFGAMLIMEIMMHTIYVVAITKGSAWELSTPLEIALLSYFNLKFVWLKLMVIWRFFRFWAMADGIETIENMRRCMTNNYSLLEFWRCWHCSFNRWIIRYIYIPLGGNKYRLYNVWVVFTFVAIWHDLQLRLLIWGWLISLFILPEVIGTTLSRRYLKHFRFYRHLAGLGAALNILMMISANLVGFVVGVDGAKDVLPKLFDYTDPLHLLSIIFASYVAAQFAFEVREEEKRNARTKIED